MAPRTPYRVVERLQKLLAKTGLGSRREIEGWIESGQVTINGRVARLGDRADERDRIMVRGRRVRLAAEKPSRVLVYHKPVGEVCTRKDPDDRPTVFHRLPRLHKARWVTVGRLDINTSGLLLITNDGELAHALMHPSMQFEREYAVRVRGEVTGSMIQSLLDGVELEDGLARFSAVRDAGGTGVNHWYHVVLTEGRNREVRRLWASQGVTANRLIRIRYGPVTLGRRLRAGRWRDLDPNELRDLYKRAGIRLKGLAKASAGGRIRASRRVAARRR